MRCDILAVGDRVTIICGSGGRAPSWSKNVRCRFCTVSRPEATFRLCDFILGNGRTCDAPMCGECAYALDSVRDFCPMHKDKLAVHREREEKFA